MSEILRLESVKKYFPVKRKNDLRAVDGISFSVGEAKVFGLVGESGCGKSTVARLILRLMEPTEGSIFFRGTDIVHASGSRLKYMRKNSQIIFQDPQASLNPRMRVLDTLGEALLLHGIVRKRRDLREHVVRLLEKVGMDRDALYRYPHEFSGGQRQRICIARALSVQPSLIVADEPLSSLDVSIQAQILNLLEELQRNSELAFVFISHDLHVIEHFSDTVAVMYLGRIVEMSDTERLFTRPLHPYTEALLSAVPRTEMGRKRERIVLKGDVPSPMHIPPGCPFHPRCHKRFAPCEKEVPVYRETENGRWASCHLWS